LTNIAENTFRILPSIGRKRILLEELKVVSHRTGVIRNDHEVPVTPRIKKSLKNIHIKKFDLSLGISTGW